jgi:hypothetical protein
MSRSDKPSAHSALDYKSDRRRWGRAQRDQILDPYKRVARPHEPTVCPQCGAVYHRGRWKWMERPERAQETLCQACHRINDHHPAGIVTLTGPFVVAHKQEMIGLARNQEEAERPEHPLNRVISIEDEAPDRLVISTTDIHLPRRIGEATTRAYHGKLTEHFDEGGYFIRVDWHRDE